MTLGCAMQQKKSMLYFIMLSRVGKAIILQAEVVLD